MKTKSLLLAGLLCAVGAISANAQSAVYSLNSVGFVNITCPPGFSLICNPMNYDGTNALDTVMPTAPKFSQIFKFNTGTGTYDVAQRGLTSWNSVLTVSPGEGFFFKNPFTTNIVLTFTGNVQQGSLSTPLIHGFQIVSSQVPQSGLVATDLTFPPARFDQLFLYNQNTGSYDVYQVTQFNTTTGVATWQPIEPTIAVGQAFFVNKVSATSWTRSFSTSN